MLITLGILLWSVIDLCGIQRPQLKTLVSVDNVTKVEKVSSTVSAALIACAMVANKMKWDISAVFYLLSCFSKKNTCSV